MFSVSTIFVKLGNVNTQLKRTD